MLTVCTFRHDAHGEKMHCTSAVSELALASSTLEIAVRGTRFVFFMSNLVGLDPPNLEDFAYEN